MACTRLEIDGGVARLTFARPEVLNALNVALLREAAAHLDAVRRRDDVRALVITGAGRGFSAGADLSAVADWREEQGAIEQQVAHYMDAYGHPLIEAILDFPAPVVCAVNGPAVGGGAAIALAGDIVVAAQSAYFLIVQPARLGLVPDLGATWFLQRLVGRARALGIALLGEKVSAEQAQQWGMIWRCVADDALLAVAMALAAQLAQTAPGVVRATRELNDAATRAELVQQMKEERERQVVLSQSPVFRAGVAGFRTTAR